MPPNSSETPIPEEGEHNASGEISVPPPSSHGPVPIDRNRDGEVDGQVEEGAPRPRAKRAKSTDEPPGEEGRRSRGGGVGGEAPDQEESPPSSTSDPFRISYTPGSLLHPRGRIAPLLPPTASRRKRLVRTVFRLGQGLHYHEVFRAAPAMAFHFFLSLLPLLVFVGWVVGLFARHAGVAAVLALVLDSLPATTEAVFKREVEQLANADRVGPLAAAGFVWIAAGGTHGLMDAVELVTGAPRRAWWKQRLHALAWVMAALAVVGVASFGIIQWDAVMHSMDDPASVSPVLELKTLLRGGGERVLTVALSLVAAVLGLAAFFRFSVTHAKRVRRRVLPGSILAVALWLVISWGFSLYIRSLVNYTVYYGSLAAVAVLLVWLWLVSLAILIGAELNSQLEGLRDLEDEE